MKEGEKRRDYRVKEADFSTPPPSLQSPSSVFGVLGQQQEGELEEKQLINSHKVRRPALGWSVPC